jgi:hypothetical protein
MTVIIQGDEIRNVTQGIFVSRATALPPQAASAGIFTITGKVLLVGILGEVTTAIGAVANATKLLYNPTAAGASTDLCATLDINADAVGTYYTLPAAVGSGLTEGVLTVPNSFPPRVLSAGQIELSCAGSSVTGAIAWTAWYVPFSDSGALVAA